MTNTTHAEAVADTMTADALGAIDEAIGNLDLDTQDALDVRGPERGRIGYVVTGETHKLIVWIDDNVLYALTQTRVGVIVGPEVAITNPTPEVVGAVVAMMLVTVVTA